MKEIALLTGIAKQIENPYGQEPQADSSLPLRYPGICFPLSENLPAQELL